jgi:hypothetical protein
VITGDDATTCTPSSMSSTTKAHNSKHLIMNLGFALALLACRLQSSK